LGRLALAVLDEEDLEERETWELSFAVSPATNTMATQ
jgi:hypothetical protein